jgi:hypothetical protein
VIGSRPRAGVDRADGMEGRDEMFLVGPIGRALRRALALGILVAFRGRRALLPAAGLIVLGYAALNVAGGAAVAPSPSPRENRSVAVAAAAPATRPAATNPATVPSVDSYIKGLTQFDAKLMWGSLSDEAIQAMRSRGGSLEALQKGLDDARQRGARYEDITMIGNYPLQDGRKYLFYVLSRRGFTGPEQLEQVYFVFTVAKDGKITRIE